MRSVSSAMSCSCGPCGGVEAGVSESLVSSFNIPSLSALLRGLDSALDSVIDMLLSGKLVLLGSQGIGLFGSLEAQLGMLVCLCFVVYCENELRLIEGSSVCGWDIMTKWELL